MYNAATVRAIWFCWFFFAVPLAATARQPLADAYGDAIEKLLSDKFAVGNAGMVIGLVDVHGSRVFSAGRLDNGGDGKVGGDTLFELGSVTKVFTVLLLLDAVRRGEMELDDPVQQRLPTAVTVPEQGGRKITLRNLAAQDSGLPWHPDNLSNKPVSEMSILEIKAASDAYSAEDLYEFLSGCRLEHNPGDAFHYSNVGMALLGNVLERRTGSDYESLVTSRIGAPLQMEDTRISLSPEQQTRLARGHWTDGTRSEHLRFRAMASAGSLISTADDLLKFLSANLGLTTTELNPLLQQMQVICHTGHPRFGKSAMPWFDEGVYNPPETEILGHGGGGFGNLAFVGFDKQRRRGVVVLTNQMNVSPYGIGWTILQGLPLTENNITVVVREITGIGIALDADEASGLPRITMVYPQSPAGRAGVSAGSLIQEINGHATQGKSLQECLRLMGGPADQKVRLVLIDSEQTQTQTFDLTRGQFLTAG